MDKVRPIYWKLLIAIGIIYVVFTTMMLSDIYFKIGRIEHVLGHEKTGQEHKH